MVVDEARPAQGVFVQSFAVRTTHADFPNALEHGYADDRSLARAFARHTGVTPGAYRRSFI